MSYKTTIQAVDSIVLPRTNDQSYMQTRSNLMLDAKYSILILFYTLPVVIRDAYDEVNHMLL